MNKKQLVIVILALTLSIILVGWFSLFTGVFKRTGSSEPVQVYFADNISLNHKFVIDEFNRLYQGKIEVIPVNLPFEKFSTNERKELLIRSLRTKSDIDLFAVDVIWVPRFTRWCEPLDKYFSQEERKRLLSQAVESCTYDQVLVAMPMYLDIGLMYYRKDIIRRLPHAEEIEQRLQSSITWDEMLQLRGQLNYENKPFYIFQAKDYEGLVCNYFEVAVSRRSDFFKNNSIPLTSSAAEEALSFMVGFVKTKVSPMTVLDFEENLSYRYMLDHDAVFVRGWPNFIENFRRFYPDTVKLSNIGRAPLPHFSGQKPTSVLGGWNLMVSKSSTKKEAAVEFIRFLQSDHIQRVLLERAGYIPVINSVYQDSTFLVSHPELTFYRKIMQNGFHRPALVEYTKTSNIISHFLHGAIKQEFTVNDALQRANTMIQSNAVLIK
ncbi:MAG: extracellular solute-binding protein [Ignavibacteriae bacterium]|nr:MAG: extracellular solute-binding protein [Ignavibacteriota bacterium]